MSPSEEITPGDRVKIIPHNLENGPIIEGVVADSPSTYVTIRGLGSTQFQYVHFRVLLISKGMHPDAQRIYDSLLRWKKDDLSESLRELADRLFSEGYRQQSRFVEF